MGLLPFMQRDLGPLTPFARFARLRAETDELLFELIAERRAEDAERDVWPCCSRRATMTGRRCLGRSCATSS
ncbi:MAG: hypothetical protein WKF33_02300 [Thermoleophilaceae bacterium]